MIFKPLLRRLSQRPRLYFDFASSTPIDFEMMKSFPKVPVAAQNANPSALHTEGVLAKKYLSDARQRCADVLLSHANEIIFTSGATESDNLAIMGTINHFLEQGIDSENICIATSTFEHSAVLEPIKGLAQKGIQFQNFVNIHGVVVPSSLTLPEGIRALLVSAMYVHNEIGTVQPIAEIAKRVRYLRKTNPDVEILFHVDATQAPLYYSLNVQKLGIDMMTLGATKLYCPKGVGLLYKRRSLSLSPILLGGGQEYGMRPGTEVLALIDSFSHALLYADKKRESSREKITLLQNYFEKRVKELLLDVRITAQESERAPHISHIQVPGFDSELLVLELDARGISLSSKSACKNEESTPSYDKAEWLETAGDTEQHIGTLRFSFGRTTTKKMIDRAVNALVSVIKKYSNVH